MTREVDYKIVDVLLSTGMIPKDSRQQTTFHECVHELSSLPMSRLSSEPAYLRDCHKTVLRESHKWAYENYDVFIQTAECTRQIFDDFEKVQNMEGALTNKIPELLNSGHRFTDECRQLMVHANMNSLTLKKHSQILEILEIPQLLEACIRNNYLDEALELIAHSRKLERRLGHIAIVANVTQEARFNAQKLLKQLFQQLGADLQLPSCLKIVGYLRRMDCLPESLLRLKFLQCRDNYLLGLLRTLASNDPFYHATKYMEMTRVNLFDIATQYRAVFNDEDLFMSTIDSLGQQHTMLFSSWLVMRVDVFINSLAADITTIIDNSLSYSHSSTTSQTNSQSVGSKLQSLLGQSMYFGLSLSRIGSDFRPLLLPVFYQAVMKFIDRRLLEISDLFCDCISNYKWTVNVEDVTGITLTQGLEHYQQEFYAAKSEEIVAPVKLMNHPLLALLLNQMLSVLEDIRLCCPKVLRKRICQSFVDTITVVMKSLLKFHEEESPNFTTNEQQSFMSMVMSLLLYFAPHVDLCLTMLFSSDEMPGRAGDSVDVRALSGLFGDLLQASFFVVFNEDDDDLAYREELDRGNMEDGSHNHDEVSLQEGNDVYEVKSKVGESEDKLLENIADDRSRNQEALIEDNVCEGIKVDEVKEEADKQLMNDDMIITGNEFGKFVEDDICKEMKKSYLEENIFVEEIDQNFKEMRRTNESIEDIERKSDTDNIPEKVEVQDMRATSTQDQPLSDNNI